MSGKKPVRCKVGLHRSYVDSAFFNNVDRCNDCDWVSSKTDAALLDAERKAWSQVSSEDITDFGEQLIRVMEILAFETDAL